MRKITFSLLLFTACQAAPQDLAPLPEAVMPIVDGQRRAIEAQIQSCLHNIANVDTYGYKASHVVLTDVVGPPIPANSQGSGVVVVGSVIDMRPGVLEVTGRPLDLAIAGRGYFQVRLPNGSMGYTRGGRFLWDAEGRLVTQSGYPLQPAVTLPQDWNEVYISSVGRVSVSTASFPDRPTLLTTLLIARFANPDELRAAGGGLFLANNDVTGAPILGTPGDAAHGLGDLMQGHLEWSNVDIAYELQRLEQLRRNLHLLEEIAPALTRGS